MKCKETERSLKRNLSTLLSAAIVVSQLVGGGLTAFAAESTGPNFKITYAVDSSATGELATKEQMSVTDGDAQSFTAAKISGVTKKGYHTDGYTVSAGHISKTAGGADATTAKEGDKYYISSAATLTVNWEATEHKISYNANGGKGTIKDQTYSIAAPVTLNGGADFTRDGYNLIGWSTSQSRSPKGWNPGQNKTTDFGLNGTTFAEDTDADVTMYAVWEAKDVWTISFDGNGATGGGPVNDIEVFNGDTFKIPENTFTRTGYKLTTGAEWNTKADGKGDNQKKNDELTPDKNATYFANWTPNTYTVHFDGNGFDGGTQISDQPMTYDTAATLSANTFTNTNADFLGWSKNSAAREPEYTDKKTVKNLATGATGDTEVTLYAVWGAKEGKHAVCYDNNGGTGSIATEIVADKDTYTVKAATSISRTNFGFIGWDTDAAATEVVYEPGDKIDEVTEDTTLYAVWGYTVDFDANDGKGSMDTQSFVAGTPQKLSTCAFTRDEYNFVGWTVSATSTEIVYEDNEEIVDAGNTVLYAVWEEVSSDNTEKAQEAADAATKAAKAATDAAAAADKAAADANANATADTVAAAKKAADAATKAAEAAKTAADAANKAAALDNVDSKVKAAAEAAATDASTAAETATKSAKAATDAATAAQAKIDEATKSDGSEKGKPVAEGKALKDANGKELSYVVTSADASKPEVEFKATEEDKKAGKVSIPETVKDQSGNEYKVTAIADNAFNGADVKEVIIPKTVKKIGTKAFYKSKAKKITIKATKKGKIKIGKNAFKTKTKKVKIRVKGAKGDAKKKIVKNIKKNAKKDADVK